MSGCPVFFYSHGCDREAGHTGDHECLYDACPDHGEMSRCPEDCDGYDRPVKRVCASVAQDDKAVFL